MSGSTVARPTDAELAILRVLWERGPSTVREVHEALPPARRVGYTTILKLLQIMTEKRLVRRDETAQVYAGLAQEKSDLGGPRDIAALRCEVGLQPAGCSKVLAK